MHPCSLTQVGQSCSGSSKQTSSTMELIGVSKIKFYLHPWHTYRMCTHTQQCANITYHMYICICRSSVWDQLPDCLAPPLFSRGRCKNVIQEFKRVSLGRKSWGQRSGVRMASSENKNSEWHQNTSVSIFNTPFPSALTHTHFNTEKWLRCISKVSSLAWTTMCFVTASLSGDGWQAC